PARHVVVVGLALLRLGVAPRQAAGPLLRVLGPMFIARLGLVLMRGFVAPAAGFPWLGRIGQPRRGPVRAFVYSAALVVLASLIPWVSWVIVLVLFPIGIGGWVVAAPISETAEGVSPAAV